MQAFLFSSKALTLQPIENDYRLDREISKA